MQAAAHTPGGYGGVPQNVGKDFVAADQAMKLHMQGRRATPQSLHARGKAHGAKHGG